jgi:chromosomal replication initiator protein
LKLPCFVRLPENHAALTAVEHLADCLCLERRQQLAFPVVIHGPSGAGKTRLVQGLVKEMAHQMPRIVVACHSAACFEAIVRGEASEQLQDCKQCDLLIVEDVHRLGVGSGAFHRSSLEALVGVLDYRSSQQLPSLLTAGAGPAHLHHFGSRLVSRLAGGLVVYIEPLQVKSRLAFLQDKSQKRQLAVRPNVLVWLAEHLGGGGRQLEGALNQVALLSKFNNAFPDVDKITRHFQDQAAANRPTIERIAERVGCYYRVEPSQLQSRKRYQNVLLPRQISMYLARLLTGLSLQQIGTYFGGRDHSTVLHACHKIEEQLEQDTALCGAVRQLTTDLQ